MYILLTNRTKVCPYWLVKTQQSCKDNSLYRGYKLSETMYICPILQVILNLNLFFYYLRQTFIDINFDLIAVKIIVLLTFYIFDVMATHINCKIFWINQKMLIKQALCYH